MGMRIREKFSNLSVTRKIILLLVVFVVIPICIIEGVIANYMYSSQKTMEHSTIALGLSSVAEDVAAELNAVAEIIEDLCFDESINDLALENGHTGSYVNSMAVLEQALEREELMLKVHIMSADGRILKQYGGESRRGYSLSDEGNEEFVELFDGVPFWSSAHVLYRLNSGAFDEEIQVVSYYHGIYDAGDMTLNGIMALHIKESSICDLYQNFLQESPEAAWMILEDGSLVSSTEKDWLEDGIPAELSWIPEDLSSGNFTVRYNGEFYRVYWQQCGDLGIYLLQMNREYGFYATYGWFIYIMLMLILILGSGFTIAYRFLVTRPLQGLARQIDRAKKLDLKQEISVVYSDEIGQLTISFQDMLHCIDDLIEKVYVERIKTQQAEQEALLSQINPHFLYNTLDSIRWNALAHGEKEIGAQIEALSMMLRGTLNFGQTMTSVEQECSIIESYCFLLKTRFRDEFRMTMDIDPEARHLCIPKLLIQPLVENAYRHGLENKIGEKEILIKIRRKKDSLCIYVADNGLGCDRALLEKRLHNTDEHDCFALKNIRSRLSLTYGASARFIFTSRAGQGTIVKLILPIPEDQDGEPFLS